MSDKPMTDQERREEARKKFDPRAGHADPATGFFIPNGLPGGHRKPEGWSPFDPIRGYGTLTED